MYSLIVKGWDNRPHIPIDTLHGIMYSLTITSDSGPGLKCIFARGPILVY